MPYSDMFKRKMVQKLTGPDALSASALSKDVDVSQPTLSKWLRKAGVGPSNPDDPLQMRHPVTNKRPTDWSPEEKLQAVLEAAALSDEQLGAFLRSKGLHETHLQQWRLQMLHGLGKQLNIKKPKTSVADAKQIRDLEKELRRKDKALAETAALIVLKKKSRKSGGTRTTTQRARTANDP